MNELQISPKATTGLEPVIEVLQTSALSSLATSPGNIKLIAPSTISYFLHLSGRRDSNS